MKVPATAALLTLVATAALAACAPVEDDPALATTASAEDRQCFFARQVSSYRDAPEGPGGEQRIYIDVGAADTFLFETFGTCPDIDFTDRVAFEQSGVGRICDGLDVDLIVSDRDLGPRRCPLRMISKVADRAR